ncbi:hypothetical protein Droror1_Dr00015932 [Drosera rotundifolia]
MNNELPFNTTPRNEETNKQQKIEMKREYITAKLASKINHHMLLAPSLSLSLSLSHPLINSNLTHNSLTHTLQKYTFITIIRPIKHLSTTITEPRRCRRRCGEMEDPIRYDTISPEHSPSSLKNRVKNTLSCCFKNNAGGGMRGNNRRRRGMSVDFRYDPLSYAMNFDDGRSEDGNVEERMVRSFSARLPRSPQTRGIEGIGE